MALGISSGGSSFRQRIGYNAKSGRMNRVDRIQGNDGMWTSVETDITDRAQFVADFENIKVGWVYFGPQGPQKVLGPLGNMPAKPDLMVDGKPAFKHGLELTVVLSKQAADGADPVREWTSNSLTLNKAIDALHDQFTGSPEAKGGKLPVIALRGTKAVKTKHGTNYEPDFAIVGWVDRPAALSGEAVDDDDEPAAAAPPPAAKAAASAPAFDPNAFG